MASLTRVFHEVGEVLNEQLRRYDEYYAQFLSPNGPDEDTSQRPTDISETVPVARLRGVGRTLAEADAELALIRETLERDDRGDGEDGGREQALDPTRHASLSPFIGDASRVPVAYQHMLWAKPNNQGKLYQQSSFSLDQCPATGNQRRSYHTLQPLPFFPLCHRGYDRKYYR